MELTRAALFSLVVVLLMACLWNIIFWCSIKFQYALFTHFFLYSIHINHGDVFSFLTSLFFFPIFTCAGWSRF